MIDADLIPILILGTLLAHILEDFHLQGILAQMKQKSWWYDEVARVSCEQSDVEVPILMKKYRYDYAASLLMHGIEWSIIIAIPAMFILGGCPWWLLVIVALNAVVHASIDNAKCNRMSINLVQDQILHMCQLSVVVIATIFC